MGLSLAFFDLTIYYIYVPIFLTITGINCYVGEQTLGLLIDLATVHLFLQIFSGTFSRES